MANGHGTLLTGSDGQGNVKVEVKDNGGSKNYSSGTQSALANGVKAKSGQGVQVEWDDRAKALKVLGAK